MRLMNGDCLELMKGIPDKSVDMILCDLPYGTTDCKWDVIIPFDELWKQYYRVIKDDGAIVLFSAQPFTTTLIHSNFKRFRYCWYWMKRNVTGFAFAKYQPMRKVEDICVFYNKKAPTYNPQGLKKLDTPIRRGMKKKGVYKITGGDHVQKYTGYPHNVLEYAKDVLQEHPTQKPVGLCEYLVRTYTRPRRGCFGQLHGKRHNRRCVREYGAALHRHRTRQGIF